MARPDKASRRLESQDETGGLLHSLFFAAPFGIQVFRADGRCVLTNPAYRGLLGLPAPDYNPLLDESAEAQRLRPLLKRALAGEKISLTPTWNPGTVHEAPSHSPPRGLALSFTLLPLYQSGTGLIDHVALIVRDATVEMTAREETGRLQRRLDNVLGLLENYRTNVMGILGHDLRTPLAVIKMSAEQLHRYGNLVEKHLRVVERMTSSTTQLTQMLAQVFDFTRSRVGDGIPLDPRPTDLAANSRMALEELRATSPDLEIELEVHGNAVGRWDSDRVRQAIANLVRNAERLGPEGAPIRMTIRDGGPDVVMTVQNAAASVAEDVAPTLLDPLHRGKLSNAQTPAARGLELGLFITQEIVRGHGGKILVQSTLEGGTTFTVRWPRQPPSEPPPSLLERLDRD